MESTWNLPAPLLELPYAERQCIVVADDAVVLAERQAAAEAAVAAAESGEGIDWARVAKRAARVGLLGVAGVTAVAVESMIAAGRAKDGGVDVLLVSRSEADVLRLPPGHPRDRVLYAGHPAMPETYYPTAAFHRFTFEHKFAEAVRLLMSLGAAELEVEHVRGWSNEFAANLAVPIPGAVAEVSGHAGTHASAGTTALFRASLSGTADPVLPDDLVWYPYEPTWAPVADGALKYGLREFELMVRYEDDYGIDAGLKLSVQKVGLDLGGTFQEHVATSWKIKGKFGPKSDN